MGRVGVGATPLREGQRWPGDEEDGGFGDEKQLPIIRSISWMRNHCKFRAPETPGWGAASDFGRLRSDGCFRKAINCAIDG
jgi:hypothetical protein